LRTACGYCPPPISQPLPARPRPCAGGADATDLHSAGDPASTACDGAVPDPDAVGNPQVGAPARLPCAALRRPPVSSDTATEAGWAPPAKPHLVRRTAANRRARTRKVAGSRYSSLPAFAVVVRADQPASASACVPRRYLVGARRVTLPHGQAVGLGTRSRAVRVSAPDHHRSARRRIPIVRRSFQLPDLPPGDLRELTGRRRAFSRRTLRPVASPSEPVPVRRAACPTRWASAMQRRTASANRRAGPAARPRVQ
jgi:hypothetical protein